MTSTLIRCKHCGEPISQVIDPWGGRHGWRHLLDEGDEAYENCRCTCSDCDPHDGDIVPCCDGEGAEPEEGAGQ
jgi:hypothetical protein